MLCSGRCLPLSASIAPRLRRECRRPASGVLQGRLAGGVRRMKPLAMAAEPDSSPFAPPGVADSDDRAAGFCIIEGPETVQDFAQMQLQEIQENVRSRRNKIFLHMEEANHLFFCYLLYDHHFYLILLSVGGSSGFCITNSLLLHNRKIHVETEWRVISYASSRRLSLRCMKVRRLRIQQRLKSAELGILGEEQENELPDFPSFIPFLPPLSAKNLKVYYATCFSLIAGIIFFGGLLAPTLELKLGLGGTSYEDFISSMHLPMQLSQVDPIVASFSGGAVGVISALMVVEINNVKQQEHKRCKYCLGTGYLACARCSSTGSVVFTDPLATLNGGNQPLSPPRTERCSNCSGAGKVMCPTCLCTGMAMASEHDPRIDPFD